MIFCNKMYKLFKFFLFISLYLFLVEGQLNNCVSFTVSAGTGCAWMCNYCAAQLGTNNYYFTDNVCTYESGGCVGNPLANTRYTCCSAGNQFDIKTIVMDFI